MLYLTQPLPEINLVGLDHFDVDGFELCEFEQQLYRNNNIPFETFGSKTACQTKWIDAVFAPGIHINHSNLFRRYGVRGALAYQLEDFEFLLTISKILQIKPKWGLDVAIEQSHNGRYIQELFHYEADFRHEQSYLDAKTKLENLVYDTDWNDVGNRLLEVKREWSHLNGDDQSDYKARFVGIDRAYNTLKVV